MNNKSSFIIMMGPAGSGKGYIESKVVSYLNNKLGMDIQDVERSLIDDLVEKDPDFIKESSDIIRKMWTIQEIEYLQTHLVDTVQTIMEKRINDEIIRKLVDTSDILSQIYFKIRKNKKYDDQNNNKIMKDIELRNDIVFETTGIGNIDWLYNDFLNINRRQNYIVILVYPYVNKSDVISQTIKRFTTQAQKILTGTDTWVRLPKVMSISDNIDNIQNNFIALLKDCQRNNNSLDYLLLYDNRPRYPVEPSIVFVNLCQYDDILECDDIKEFIKTINEDKVLYSALEKEKCIMNGGYDLYRKYLSIYKNLKKKSINV